ncbi:MAG: hypothetical protein JRI68_04615 [Deltaproteobacteria bacterium]|nr:hypothetical protein [Deltaproteobacteria bacterium]
MADQDQTETRFAIPIPGGRVARVPLQVLEQYVDSEARACHAHEAPEADVVAHHLATDAQIGVSDWHTDWEYGDCTYTDASGFATQIQGWHRHPLATEYTELYEGQ